MNRLILVVMLMAAAAAGCAASAGARAPEEAVEAAYGLCQAGRLQEAAQYFDGGPQVWEASPALIGDACDRVTEAGRLMVWVYTRRTTTGDAATIRTDNYLNAARSLPGRTLDWRLVRKHGRWLITEVM